jgi:hypothetical protein
MAIEIRQAGSADVAAMTEFLRADATHRQARDPVLWQIAADSGAAIAVSLRSAFEAGPQPFWQAWFAAFAGGELVGLAHAMRLAVPPIYAGRWGDPGLIREDCALSPTAPPGTADLLFAAAEDALRSSGARLLLAAALPDGPWSACAARNGYAPLTLYLSRSLESRGRTAADTRPANAADIPAIVALSAIHRRNLAAIHPFWTPHPQADERFGAWMTRSLGFADRDMLVAGSTGDAAGFAVAQPASRLHVPPGHAIDQTGVLDDFFHADFADPDILRDQGRGAAGLLASAEASLALRGRACAFVVCPAQWRSKRAVLEAAGYRTALFWTIAPDAA